MRTIFLDGVIALLIIMNFIVGCMIYSSMQPKCFVDGCNCARIKAAHYCRKHSDCAAYEISYTPEGKEICLKVKIKN